MIIYFKILFYAAICSSFIGIERTLAICDPNELHCISCNGYSTCMNGQEEEVYSPCDDEDGCGDPKLQQCQTLLNCYSAETYAIATDECTDIGIFRDRITESKFYVCLTDSSSGFIKLGFSCAEDEFFDESSMQCMSKAFTLASGENSTSAIAMATSSEATSSAITTTPSSSTTLTTISPEKPVMSTTMQLSTSTATAPTTEPTPISQVQSPACTVPGVFADPTNCKMYYRCSTALIRVNYTCPGFSYFNEDLMKCSLNVTSTCLNQIAKNATTLKPFTEETSFPTLPMTTPTTQLVTDVMISSSSESSTENSPTATTSNISKPFACPYPGIFPDPANCTTYFRCSINGIYFKFSCPGKTYFNSVTKKCSLKMTPECKTLLAV